MTETGVYRHRHNVPAEASRASVRFVGEAGSARKHEAVYRAVAAVRAGCG